MVAKGEKRKTRPGSGAGEARRILETALKTADRRGWATLSLTDLAQESGVTLPQLRRHYADLNAIADAWFALALDAMLAPPAKGFADLETVDRLDMLLWRWFTALAPHRRTSADMLRTKMHGPHLHHWVPMVFDLSRLVQLWRDGAGLRAQGRQRQVEEVGLTGIFLVTLADWCSDESDGQEMSRARLRARLGRADRLMTTVFGHRQRRRAVTNRKP